MFKYLMKIRKNDNKKILMFKYLMKIRKNDNKKK